MCETFCIELAVLLPGVTMGAKDFVYISGSLCALIHAGNFRKIGGDHGLRWSGLGKIHPNQSNPIGLDLKRWVTNL